MSARLKSISELVRNLRDRCRLKLRALQSGLCWSIERTLYCLFPLIDINASSFQFYTESFVLLNIDMATQDPHKSQKVGEHRKQRTVDPDTVMTDAPPPKEAAPRRPIKIEIRSGNGRGGPRHDGMDDRTPRSGTTYSRTIHSTYETEQHYRPTSSGRESQRIIESEWVAVGKHPEPQYDSQDACEVHLTKLHDSLEEEQNRRRALENDNNKLRASLKVLQDDLNKEHEWRKQAESDLSQSRTHLTQSTQSSQNESQLRMSLETDLRRKDSEIKNTQKQLETERAQRTADKEQWDTQKQQSEAELKVVTKKWKQVARELGGLRAQGQRFYQVTDNYLEGLIKGLRYNMRNFAIQYFSGKLSKPPEFDRNSLWQKCMESIIDGSNEAYMEYVNCPDRRPSIVQAFLWRVLNREVFYNFKWAGKESLPMWELYLALKSRLNSGPTMSPAGAEAIKKVHTWRATTVGLLLDSMDNTKRLEADTELQKWKYKLFEDIDANLRLLQPEYQEGYRQDFLDIIDEAIKLDQEICKQVSRVAWTYPAWSSSARAFDPTGMDCESGERPPHGKAEVAMVISPGVEKQGKSTGEGFESTMCLLKMEVLCKVPKE